jgi:hypothetical protein
VAPTLSRSESGRTGRGPGTRLEQRKASLLDGGTRTRMSMRIEARRRVISVHNEGYKA